MDGDFEPVADGHPLACEVPHLAQYFGPWLITEERGLALAQLARTLDLKLHLDTKGAQTAAAVQARSGDDRGYAVADGTAIIELAGPLMKSVSSYTEGTSTVEARRQVRAAVADPNIAHILLLLDSPGGTSAGTQELADDVAWAARRKPTYGQINDLCASACYWIGAQCEMLFANKTALVGSIGTYMVVQDLSQMAEKEGIKVHVIRAGEFKGMGTPGTEVTPEQLDEIQRIVNGINDHFLAAVAKGRGIDKATVKGIADGRIHLAAKAKQLNLIDGVQSLDETLSQLRSNSKPGGSRRSAGSVPNQESNPMPEATTAQAPLQLQTAVLGTVAAAAATFEELEKACPRAGAEFLCAQLKKKATVDQAVAAWNEARDARLEALEKENAELQAKAKADMDDECDDEEEEKSKGKSKSCGKNGKAKSALPGAAPLRASESGAASSCVDPRGEWKQLLEAKMKGGMKRVQAATELRGERPDLVEALAAQSARRSQSV